MEDDDIAILPKIPTEFRFNARYRKSPIFTRLDNYYRSYQTFRNQIIQNYKDNDEIIKSANDMNLLNLVEKLKNEETVYYSEFQTYYDSLSGIKPIRRDKFQEINSVYKEMLIKLREKDIEIRNLLSGTAMWHFYAKIEPIFIFSKNFEKFLGKLPRPYHIMRDMRRSLHSLEDLLNAFYHTKTRYDYNAYIDKLIDSQKRLKVLRSIYKEFEYVLEAIYRYPDAWQSQHIILKIKKIVQYRMINSTDMKNPILKLAISIFDTDAMNTFEIDEETQVVRALYDIDNYALVTKNIDIINEHTSVVDKKGLSQLYLPVEIDNHGTSIFDDFRNHEKSNCIYKDDAIYATKDIRIGEELFIDISDEILMRHFKYGPTIARDKYIQKLRGECHLHNQNSHEFVDLWLRINMLETMNTRNNICINDFLSI